MAAKAHRFRSTLWAGTVDQRPRPLDCILRRERTEHLPHGVNLTTTGPIAILIFPQEPVFDVKQFSTDAREL